MAELVVALDYPGLTPAISLVRSIQGRVSWFKVGLELFSACGPRAVEAVRDCQANVFLDLKLMDIPRTVLAAARTAARMGAGMFTVHLSGGERMVQAALQGRERGGSEGQKRPLVLGVTLLTSLGRQDIAWMGDRDSAELVLQLAESGRKWGVDGVVCSAREAHGLKSAFGPSFLCVTPGIRMEPGPGIADDQVRTATPAEAVAAGADYLVVGRPVTAAQDPVLAVNGLIAAMAAAWPGGPQNGAK